LTQIQEAIKSGASRSELADLSSDFYSLVPHDFGRRRPTIIDNEIMLKAKMEMLEVIHLYHLFIVRHLETWKLLLNCYQRRRSKQLIQLMLHTILSILNLFLLKKTQKSTSLSKS